MRALLAIGGAIVLVAMGAGWSVWREFERDPSWLALAIARGGGLPADAVSVGWFDADLRSWRFELRDLTVAPPGESAARVEIRSLQGRLPRLSEWRRDGVVHLGDVVLDGLLVTVPTQRSPRPLAEPVLRPVSLAADRLTLLGGAYRAADDAPLPRVEADGVRGELRNFRWWPARRRVVGEGELTAGRLAMGAIDLGDVDAAVVASGTQLALDGVSFRYGSTAGTASGRIEELDGRPATEFEVVVAGEEVARAIETATGRPSPLRGRLTARLVLRSGGALPRGGARFTGWSRIEDVRIHLGPRRALRTRVLVAVAPGLRVERGDVAIGDLEGRATFGRGWVVIHSLERPSERHRVLQAWGRIVDGEIDLRIRAVPAGGGATRTGWGVVVQGDVERPRVRLAREADLEDAPSITAATADDRG